MGAVASDFSSVACGLSTVGEGVEADCSTLSTGGCAAGFLGTKTGSGRAPVPPMGADSSDFSSVVCGLSTVDCGLEIGFLGAKAVSYTHLDVYKRQGIFRLALPPC